MNGKLYNNCIGFTKAIVYKLKNINFGVKDNKFKNK